MEDQVFYLIKDFGIPAVLCIYMMTIGFKIISKNTEAIRELKTIVQIMSGKLKVSIK